MSPCPSSVALRSHGVLSQQRPDCQPLFVGLKKGLTGWPLLAAVQKDRRANGGRVGGPPCLDSRALRERGQRCLHGRDYARAATYYAQAEYLTLVQSGITPETTELAILADYCLKQAARTQR